MAASDLVASADPVLEHVGHGSTTFRRRARPAVQIGLDRPDRAPEDGRDLGVGKVLVVPEHEHGPLARRQLGQHVEQLTRFERDHLVNCPTCSPGALTQAAPMPRPRTVDHRLAQVGDRVLDGLPVLLHRDERGLDHVFRGRVRPQQHVGEPDHLGVVAVEQLREVPDVRGGRHLDGFVLAHRRESAPHVLMTPLPGRSVAL